jgi:molybdopterin-guanine dinucleotide biosynthesis protein A
VLYNQYFNEVKMKYQQISGYIQAGGGSTRFGSDKALAVFDGKSLLKRTAELLEETCGTVKIVSSSAIYADSGISILRDAWPGEGPLGGIITAIGETRNHSNEPAWSLIVSCDMPFLSREWLDFLCQRALESDAQVVVPESESGLEPLCACWRSDALEIVQVAFHEGVRKVTQGMKCLRREVLDERAWKRFDNDGRLFWNMNTPEDYVEAKRILGSGKR